MFTWLKTHYYSSNFNAAHARLLELDRLERDTRTECARQLNAIRAERINLKRRLSKFQARLMQNIKVA